MFALEDESTLENAYNGFAHQFHTYSEYLEELRKIQPILAVKLIDCLIVLNLDKIHTKVSTFSNC